MKEARVGTWVPIRGWFYVRGRSAASISIVAGAGNVGPETMYNRNIPPQLFAVFLCFKDSFSEGVGMD